MKGRAAVPPTARMPLRGVPENDITPLALILAGNDGGSLTSHTLFPPTRDE